MNTTGNTGGALSCTFGGTMLQEAGYENAMLSRSMKRQNCEKNIEHDINFTVM